MKPGRVFSFLTGVALLGGIAGFNEMTPDAQASLLDAAAETARTAAQSLLSNAVATYNQVTGRKETASGDAGHQPAASRAGEGQAGGSAPAQRVAARAQEADQQSGNPLWALPLKQLSMTRDRPIFSPSRRPPPPPTPTLVAPVAVRQVPVKPPEPERPTVALLGTIIGPSTDDQIAVFLDTATQSVVRLRIGEDHQGWVLRVIKAREATLAKSGEQTVLEMAAPGDAPLPGVAGPMPGIPAGVMPPPAGLPPAYQNAIANGIQPGAVQQQRPRRQR